MNGEERKLSIISAAASIFSQKGFHGTSVRNIAEAAGVSEALLYKHFASKEEIYLSLGKYIEGQLLSLVKGFRDSEPGGKMMVELVYCLVMMILTDMPGKTEMQRSFERLLAYSLLENIDFAKKVFLNYSYELSPIWDKAVNAAIKNKEVNNNLKIKNKMWFVHHLAMAINFLSFSGEKLFPFKGTFNELVEEIIKFALVSIGLTDKTIEKYYKPSALKKRLMEVFG